MAVTYKELFHSIIDRGINNAGLMEQAGLSASIITRLKHDNYLSLDTVEKVYRALNCGVDDILEFTPEIKKIGGNMYGQLVSAEVAENA